MLLKHRLPQVDEDVRLHGAWKIKIICCDTDFSEYVGLVELIVLLKPYIAFAVIVSLQLQRFTYRVSFIPYSFSLLWNSRGHIHIGWWIVKKLSLSWHCCRPILHQLIGYFFRFKLCPVNRLCPQLILCSVMLGLVHNIAVSRR